MVKLDKNENHCLFDKTIPESAPYRYFTSYDYGCQVLAICFFPDEFFQNGTLVKDMEYRINQIKKIEESSEIQNYCNLMLYWVDKYENSQVTLKVLREKIVQILDKFENIEVQK